jgi:two-component system, OmpR family, alkaline phosphatase synthesis response regulator PhoP
MALHRILVITHDIQGVISLQQILLFEGYSVELVNSSQALEGNMMVFNLIFIDLHEGAKQMCKVIRQMQKTYATTNIPLVIVLPKDAPLSTAMDDIGDDCYFITKPFSTEEVKKMTSNILLGPLRRDLASETTTGMYAYKGLTLSIDMKKVMIQNEVVHLTKKEFELLHLFLKNKNHLFSRKEILENVWREDKSVTHRTIDVNVARLREKLGIYKANIITRLGFGYGFEE